LSTCFASFGLLEKILNDGINAANVKGIDSELTSGAHSSCRSAECNLKNSRQTCLSELEKFTNGNDLGNIRATAFAAHQKVCNKEGVFPSSTQPEKLAEKHEWVEKLGEDTDAVGLATKLKQSLQEEAEKFKEWQGLAGQLIGKRKECILNQTLLENAALRPRTGIEHCLQYLQGKICGKARGL